MKGKRQEAGGKSIFKGLKIFLKLFTFYFLIFTFIGCDAFVRKFTRKSKKEDLPREEMVVAPEEYVAPQVTKEELYRQYLLYWKSWYDELITALRSDTSHKKQLECIDEAAKNLGQLRPLLNEEKQKALDNYLNQIKGLREALSKDLYGNNKDMNRLMAENIKRNILRDFSYKKVKDYLR